MIDSRSMVFCSFQANIVRFYAVSVDANGNVLFMFPSSSTLTLDDGAMGLADADGTALVIHETVDDLVTDPSGNSGARIACAVIATPQ